MEKVVIFNNKKIYCKEGKCRPDVKERCVFDYRKDGCIDKWGLISSSFCLETIGSSYVVVKVEEEN